MSTKVFVLFITFGFCFGYSQNSSYSFLNRTQQTPSDINHNIKTLVIDKKPGEVVSVQTLRDGTTRVNKVDLTEMVDLIVEMKEKPLFIQRLDNSNFVLQKSAYINRFVQFRSDLGALHQSSMSSLRTTLGAPVIKREFHKIFFGAAVRVPRAMISQIVSLNYVKKVHLDVQIKALLDHSVHQIHADSVWTKLGVQGDSIVVGIIDTGIDYLDIALGGGFGPGFKVIGGYDFVNNDDDPMDDYGHGTHVAGIVAANSDSLKGVAPHAKLMAFKVLDQYGSGTESNVLAGIERTADPNDDGNSNDMVDVVNMSLGGSGTADDALSIAVDNAVKLGITFCIAAGNSSDNFTIGSPGTARLAITVGAVDENDEIASFSSKGPNSVICSIKPEIVAPGVNILSTLPGNTSGRYSGTSMATPHVAGVCALLKSMHRNWTPTQIKSAVMTTALDLGEEAMAQGAGRIDALKAAEVSTFVVPSHLSFGLAEFTPTWTTAETLWVSNQSSMNQSFTMSFDKLQSGISLSAVPSSFSLAKYNSQQVIVTISVDSSQVPYPTRSSLTYSGNAHLYGTVDTLHIPWAFVKAAKVNIAFDQPHPIFYLSDTTHGFGDDRARWLDPTHAEFVAPNGIYCFVAYLGNSPIQLVIKERVTIYGATSLSIVSAAANYSIALQGVDQNNQPISSHQFQQKHFLFHFPSSSGLGNWVFTTSHDSMFVSGFSDQIKLVCGEHSFQPPGNVYSLNYSPLHGLQENKTLTNLSRELYTQNLKVEFPPHSLYKGMNFIFWSKIIFGSNGLFYLGDRMQKDLVDFIGEWNGTLYLNSEKDSCSFPISLLAFDQPWDSISHSAAWLISAPMVIAKDSVGMFYGFEAPPGQYLSPNNGTMTLGGGLHYADVYSVNNSYGSSNIAAFPDFYGALDEYKETSTYRSQFSIYDKNGNIIASDSLIKMMPIDVPPGEYKLEVKHRDYYVKGLQGHATLTTRFDLQKSDADPPRITSLKLLNSKGQSQDSLSVGENGTLIFSASEADSTKLFFRKHGTALWNSIPVTLWKEHLEGYEPRGYIFKSDMTEAAQFDSTAIDIKLIFQDHSSNSTEWSLEPAFSVGAFNPPVAVEEEKNKELSIPLAFSLRQNYPNPFNPSTTIEFDIPHNSFVTIDIFNLLGQKVVTVLAENLKAGTHKIPWNAQNLSSGVYFYKLNAGSFTDTKKLLLLK